MLLTALLITMTLAVGLLGGLAISLSTGFETPEDLAAHESVTLPWVLAASISLASIAVWIRGRKYVPRTPAGGRHTVWVVTLFLAPTFVLVIGTTLLQTFVLSLLPIGPERHLLDPQGLG